MSKRTKERRSIVVRSKAPPTVELDSSAHAAYIRFSKKAVVRTVPLMADSCTITVDIDRDDQVIGIELIGVDEFGIKPLLEKSKRIQVPGRLLERARYVPAPIERVETASA